MTTGADILALEDRRWEAQIDKDLDTLNGLFADELRYTHSNGTVDTKTSYLKAIEDLVFDYRSSDRTDTEVQLVGDTALVTGRARFNVVAGGRDLVLDARYSAVWARHDDQWRFLSWQSTPLPS